jgi:IPT/TIG domain
VHYRVFTLCLFLLALSRVEAQNSDSKTASSINQKEASTASEDASQSKMKIDSVKPDSASVAQTIAITGSGFGDSGTVSIRGTDATVTSWGDTLILATVPDGLAIGAADVVVKHKEADKVLYQGKFEIKATNFDKGAFEVMTGVGASFLPVESTSYKVDTTNNALSQTNVGRKHLELLLGAGFILPWGTKYPGAKVTDPDYKNFHPYEAFLSLRFAPGSDQTFTGFVVGGGYRVHKYFSLLVGFSLTPIDEPSAGFRRAATQVVTANPAIFPYNQYNANDLANNKPGAFDGFPLFLYNATGATTTKIFPTAPTVTHAHSGIFFGVGVPINLGALLKPSKSQ